MKNKILAILLSFTLIFTTTVLGFAEDEVGSSSEPEKQSEQVVADNTKKAPVEVNVEKEGVVKEEPTLEKEATTESNEATKDAPAAKKSEANVKGAAAVQSTQDGEDDISINAKPKSMSIEVGKTEINNPIIGGESRDVTVKSNDETVATVVWENGVAKVTGVAEGSAKITYTLKSGTKEVTDDFTVTVVASGQEYVNVTFKDFFDNPIKNELVVKGKKATMPAGPKMECYQFAGWKIGSEEATYQEGAQVTVNDDTVFKATYTQSKYTVSCTTSHGTVTPESQEIVAGRYASKPTLNVSGNEIKKGDEIINASDGKYYKFLGWYNGDIEYGFNEPVVGDVTLTAKWQEVQCTITFLCATGVKATYTVDKGGSWNGKAPSISASKRAPSDKTYIGEDGYFAKLEDGTTVETKWCYFRTWQRANTNTTVNGGKSISLSNITSDVIYNAVYEPEVDGGTTKATQGRYTYVTVLVVDEITGEIYGNKVVPFLVEPAYGNTTLLSGYTTSNVTADTAKFGTIDVIGQLGNTITIDDITYEVNSDTTTHSLNAVWLCTQKQHVYGCEHARGGGSYGPQECGGGCWTGIGNVTVKVSKPAPEGKANLIVNYCLNSASNIITSQSHALDDGDTMSSAPYVNKYKSSYGEAGTPAWVTGSEGAKAEEGNTYELNIIYHTGPFKLTINYVDEEGVELEESFVQENMYRTDPYRQESPDIEGYILKDSRQAVISGQMGSSDVEIDVVYEEVKSQMTITAEGYEGTYDGESHKANKIEANVEGATLTFYKKVDGEWVKLDVEPSITNAGTDQYKVVASKKNYEDAEATFTLKVNKKAITLTSESDSWTYDGKAHSAEGVDASVDFAPGEGVSYSDFASVTEVADTANNTFKYSFNNETNPENYVITQKFGKLEIKPAKLTITADDKTKVAGSANPELTYSIKGFVNGEDKSVIVGTPVLSTTAKTNSPAGKYPINIIDKEMKAANYSFVLVDGTLTITAAPGPGPNPDPDNPDNPVVGPTDGNAVKTGDADACWASLNLILALATCVIAFMMIISMLMRRDDEEIEDTKAFFESSWFERILSGVVGVFALLIFLITENMNLPMVWADRWTFMMIVIFALQILVVAFAKNKDKAREE